MWELDKTIFHNLFWDSIPSFESEVFRNALKSKGLENEIVEITCYTPPYIEQIEIDRSYFISGLSDYWLGVDVASWVRFPIMKVDTKVFNGVKKLCFEYKLEGHEEQLASLLRSGYCFYTLAEIISNKYHLVDSYKELKAIIDLALSKSEIDVIKFYDRKGKAFVFKSELVKSLITNSINESLAANTRQGWLTEFENEKFANSELHIKYRNLLIFHLTYYLFRVAKFIKVNKNNKISITSTVGDFIASLLEIAQIPLKVSKKFEGNFDESSNESTLISSHLKMAMKTFKHLDRFLYKGPFTEEEEEMMENTDILVDRIKNDKLAQRYK